MEIKERVHGSPIYQQIDHCIQIYTKMRRQSLHITELLEREFEKTKFQIHIKALTWLAFLQQFPVSFNSLLCFQQTPLKKEKKKVVNIE